MPISPPPESHIATYSLTPRRHMAIAASIILQSLGITESPGLAAGGEATQRSDLVSSDGSGPVLSEKGGKCMVVERKFPLGQVTWLLVSQSRRDSGPLLGPWAQGPHPVQPIPPSLSSVWAAIEHKWLDSRHEWQKASSSGSNECWIWQHFWWLLLSTWRGVLLAQEMWVRRKGALRGGWGISQRLSTLPSSPYPFCPSSSGGCTGVTPGMSSTAWVPCWTVWSLVNGGHSHIMALYLQSNTLVNLWGGRLYKTMHSLLMHAFLFCVCGLLCICVGSWWWWQLTTFEIPVMWKTSGKWYFFLTLVSPTSSF